MNDFRKYINLVESIQEDSQSIELTNYTIENKDRLQKLIQNVWPNITYRGMPILDGNNSYYDQLEYLVKINPSYNDQNNYSQEVYLGYDMVDDVFYSGYDGDPWENEEDYYDDEVDEGMGSALYKIKVDNGRLQILSHNAYGTIFYPRVFREMDANPNIIHLRLD